MMSDLIQTIAYIKLPTTDDYGTAAISSASFLEEDQELLLSLKWLANGVQADLAFSMLNRLITHSTYFSYDSQKAQNYLAFL